jgi:hypothetical protein
MLPVHLSRHPPSARALGQSITFCSRKVLMKHELPQHSVDAVPLDEDIEHQEGSREPVAVVVHTH